MPRLATSRRRSQYDNDPAHMKMKLIKALPVPVKLSKGLSSSPKDNPALGGVEEMSVPSLIAAINKPSTIRWNVPEFKRPRADPTSTTKVSLGASSVLVLPGARKLASNHHSKDPTIAGHYQSFAGRRKHTESEQIRRKAYSDAFRALRIHLFGTANRCGPVCLQQSNNEDGQTIDHGKKNDERKEMDGHEWSKITNFQVLNEAISRIEALQEEQKALQEQLDKLQAS